MYFPNFKASGVSKALLRSALCLLIISAPCGAVAAAPSSAAQETEFKPGSIESTIHATLFNSPRARSYFKDAPAMGSFYKERNYKPYWVNDRGAGSQARDLLEAIEESWTHGLNPKTYHAENIRGLINQRHKENLADLDILLSDAYIRLAQDLTGIRLNPADMDTSGQFWRHPYDAGYLFSLLSSNNDMEGLIRSLSPQGQTYKRLREELKRLVKEDAEENITPVHLSKTLNPYERDEKVPQLRARLHVPQGGDDPYIYDDRLSAAVIEFQKQNGLKPDGIVGSQTLEILNKTNKQKIGQIIANLERLRWVEENKPDKFVVVNIPSATLWAVDGGKVQFEMPVIVGRKKRPTNTFVAQITGVRFNPTWTVPPTIKKEDILPKLKEDPEYLSSKGMELVSGVGENALTIDPASVDWAAISEDDLKQFNMVQTPGSHNPLGQIRVLMPNRYNIYLHDTNERGYFSRASRAASSGCVRLKEPKKMADFIMRSGKSWNDAQMESLLGAGKMRDVFIKNPIPVYLLYYTVWINEKGELVYGNDLYGYDKKLIKMLSDIDGILIPVDNNGSIRAAMSGLNN